MGQTTDIEWCDSTLNLMMGCDGCELWNPKAGVKHCYAGVLTGKYAGRKGWPAAFDQPALFVDRLAAALKWPDLTGKPRPDKPWLDGRPRMVFLNDMGDTFTESLPLDWLAPLLPRMADSPHVWMLLTKRGRRLREFSEAHPLPPNVWPAVSVTTAKTLPRVAELMGVRGGGVKWVSVEPLLGPVDLRPYLPRRMSLGEIPGAALNDGCVEGVTAGIELVIVGGESGPDARDCDLGSVRFLRDQCEVAEVACFIKQLGDNPMEANPSSWPNGYPWGDGRVRLVGNGTGKYLIRGLSPKGGNPLEWAEDLRVRQFPAVKGV